MRPQKTGQLRVLPWEGGRGLVITRSLVSGQMAHIRVPQGTALVTASILRHQDKAHSSGPEPAIAQVSQREPQCQRSPADRRHTQAGGQRKALQRTVKTVQGDRVIRGLEAMGAGSDDGWDNY